MFGCRRSEVLIFFIPEGFLSLCLQQKQKALDFQFPTIRKIEVMRVLQSNSDYK